MRHRRKLTTVPTVALGILAILTAPVLGQASGPGDDPPVVLHLADADPGGMPSQGEAEFFEQRVHDLSGGDMTVEVTSGAAIDADQPMGPEVVVAQMVQAGDFELGMTTARPWDLIGVTSLQALQAPFLIDDTALAVEVARSDIAQRALDGMSSAGLTGLALWPEHMRYLFAYPVQGKAILSPADVAGSTLTAGFSASGRRYLTDMGATIWAGDDLEADVDSGVLKGGEFGFFNGPANDHTFATGNLAFYPRTKVLFANAPAIASLSDAQRAILIQAAQDTREDAISQVADEATQATRWCQLDGHVAFATDEAIAAFHAAAQPTIDSLRQDPLTALLIDDITTLKPTVTPGSKAQACDPPAGTELYPVHDAEGYEATMPPAGKYRAEETVDHMLANGVEQGWAERNQGLHTWTFGTDTISLDAQNPDGPHHCDATAVPTADGRAIHVVTDPGGRCGIDMDFLWKPDGDGIWIVLSADPESRGTAEEIKEFQNFQGHIETVRWVRVP